MKRIFIIILLIVLAVSISFSEECFDIDWVNGRIYSSASVYVKNDHDFASNRIAGVDKIKEEAKLNFYKILKIIKLYDSISVLDYFEERSDKNRELFSCIDNAELYKIKYPDLNTIKITYFINIYGDNSLMSMMMSERDIFTENLKGYTGHHYETKYTGVIIDARGELESFDGFKVRVKPSLFIKIKDSEGRLVFDQGNIYPQVIREKGMVKYSYDINEDQKSRVGVKPLFIVAYGTGNRAGSHIVITESDAMRMLSSEVTRNAIQNGMVVVVIDREKGKDE